MVLRYNTRVIVLVGSAVIVAIFLIIFRRDRIAMKNQISHLISNEDLGEEEQRMKEIANRGKSPNSEVLKQSVKNMEKALQTMRMKMNENEVERKGEVKALHNQLNDARASWKVSPRMKSVKDSFRITEWWQASSLLKWDWEKPPEYTCVKEEMKGNWLICNDKTFEVKPPCLVYSFGIWDDWSFDDAMGALGCEVHSFDPSIGLKPFNRSKNVHFHDLGLSGKDSDTYVPTQDIYVRETTTWKIRRLKTIMEMLGHTNRHLDVLKIDIETSEWLAVKDIVASGVFSKVRQFSVEWHLYEEYPSRSKFINFYANAMTMKEQGLQTFNSNFHTKDYNDKSFRLQADVNYVNTLYKGL